MRVRGSRLLKSLDRLAGVPTVALLGLRRTRVRPAKIRRLGILRTAAIGDTLLLSGPIADLRREFKDADIVLVTGEQNAEAGVMVARNRSRHVRISVLDPLRAIRTLRAERLDVLIDTGAWPRVDAILTALSGARYSIGFRSVGQARHFAYDLAVSHSSSVHELENFRALVGALGVRTLEAPSIALSPADDESAAEPSILFHPWSGGYRGSIKEWPAARWVELARSLRTVAATFLVSGGAGDVERSSALVADLQAAGVRSSSLAGKLSLDGLAAQVRRCVAVVSVNTGVMHLAAILNAPTVALDGPTPPHRWGPIGPRAVSVAAELPGCGFLNHGFEYRGRRTDCMAAISVRAVAEAVERLISVS